MSDASSATAPLQTTPLNALHLELGARMVPFAGYSMPVQYPRGLMAEHVHTRTQAEGHEIGNHTYTHPRFDEITRRQLEIELSLTERLLEGRLGIKTILFRPPYSIDAEPDTIHVLPTVWFRNTWSWDIDTDKPRLVAAADAAIAIDHPDLGPLELSFLGTLGGPIGPGGSSLNGVLGWSRPVAASNRNCAMKLGPGMFFGGSRTLSFWRAMCGTKAKRFDGSVRIACAPGAVFCRSSAGPLTAPLLPSGCTAAYPPW